MTEKKSCLRKLEAGDLLFKDGDKASSLFIIQSGQIRLFRPKGEGYIEIAVLRAGEVMGEMAFFDEENENGRSCSAEALTPAEVIEVSFAAFGKTIQNLNPWFRVVFNVMANRLRRANSRVKSLESNNVSHGFGADSVKNYKFFMTNDIIRSLSVLFLVLKGHGEQRPEGIVLSMKPLIFYAQDIFNIIEVKFLEFCYILAEHDLCSFVEEQDGVAKTIVVQDAVILRNLMIFFNSQKVSAKDKQIKISYRCELFLERIIGKVEEKGLAGERVSIPLHEVLEGFKREGKKMDITDLEDAKHHGLVGDVSVIKEGELSLPVNVAKIRKVFTAIKLMNSIERFNESKQKIKRYG